MRWLEEYEMKHVELRRCIKSFHKMHSAWESIANNCGNLGHSAFSRRQSELYCLLHDDAVDRFKRVGYSPFVTCNDSELVSEVYRFRNHELGWLNIMAKCAQ